MVKGIVNDNRVEGAGRLKRKGPGDEGEEKKGVKKAKTKTAGDADEF